MLLYTVTNYCSSQWQVLITYDFLEDTGFTAVWFGTENLSAPPPSITLWNIKNFIKLEKTGENFLLKYLFPQSLKNMQLLLPFPEIVCPCILCLLSLCDRPWIGIQSTITVCWAQFFCVQSEFKNIWPEYQQPQYFLQLQHRYATTMYYYALTQM